MAYGKGAFIDAYGFKLNSDETYCAVRGLPTDEFVIIASTSEITDGSKVYYGGVDKATNC